MSGLRPSTSRGSGPPGSQPPSRSSTGSAVSQDPPPSGKWFATPLKPGSGAGPSTSRPPSRSSTGPAASQGPPPSGEWLTTPLQPGGGGPLNSHPPPPSWTGSAVHRTPYSQQQWWREEQARQGANRSGSPASQGQSSMSWESPTPPNTPPPTRALPPGANISSSGGEKRSVHPEEVPITTPATQGGRSTARQEAKTIRKQDKSWAKEQKQKQKEIDRAANKAQQAEWAKAASEDIAECDQKLKTLVAQEQAEQAEQKAQKQARKEEQRTQKREEDERSRGRQAAEDLRRQKRKAEEKWKRQSCEVEKLDRDEGLTHKANAAGPANLRDVNPDPARRRTESPMADRSLNPAGLSHLGIGQPPASDFDQGEEGQGRRCY